jgi:hypothetical protein
LPAAPSSLRDDKHRARQEQDRQRRGWRYQSSNFHVNWVNPYRYFKPARRFARHLPCPPIAFICKPLANTAALDLVYLIIKLPSVQLGVSLLAAGCASLLFHPGDLPAESFWGVYFGVKD